MDTLATLAAVLAFELGLFAAFVFLIFGADDLLIDIFWLCGIGRTVVSADSIGDRSEFRFAIAIPAWDEAEVIRAMVDTARTRWPDTDCRFYVGAYPNDLATMREVAGLMRLDTRIQLVVCDRPGPTTKGDCLNGIWRRVCADRQNGRFVADALLLHDAEDVVDAAELKVLAYALADADYAQIPVVPLVAQEGPWISGHYCDEFAEAHSKELPVRSALGAPMPTAGVGCAFRVEALASIATEHGPFRADSLTEDYELGVRLSGAGARGCFIRARHADGSLVASRAYFPHRIDQSVRQKTRWLRGIALEGWGRLGWWPHRKAGASGWVVGWWMLWRDRRAMLSAIAIVFGYGALIAGLTGWIGTGILPLDGSILHMLMLGNLGMLLWRLAMRGLHTAQIHGWRQGIRAVLRQPVSNIILVMTAWRALRDHVLGMRGKPLVWDKTVHHFPML